MKKNNTLKVVLIAILFTYFLTWILPINYFNGSLISENGFPAGLFDMFNYPTLTLYYFGSTAIYVLVVGAFYGVFNKTGVFRKVCDKIVKLFKGKEKLFFITVVTLLSTIVAFCGFGYELIFLLPLVASIILLMGYSKLMVAVTFIGSTAVGFAGSLFASKITGTYMETLATNYTDLIWFRLAMLILGIALLVFVIIRNMKKMHSKKDEVKDLIAEKIDVKSKKGKLKPSWPAILIFDLIVLLMILGALDFSGAFNTSIFTDFHQKVMTVTINDFLIFGKLFGSGFNQASFGNWSATEYITIMLLSTFVLAIIYRVKLSDMFDSYKEGAKKFSLAAFLMVIVYTILITTSNHPIVLTILKPILQITNGFNSVTISIAMFVGSLFNIDVYYTSSAMLPYITSIATDASTYPLIGFISQVMHSLAILIAPTSVVLLGVTSYLNVSYFEWVKNIWKFLLGLLLIAFVLFIIVLLI